MQVSYTHDQFRALIERLSKAWGGARPHAVLACAGGTDEHWQLYHLDDIVAGATNEDGATPTVMVLPNGDVEYVAVPSYDYIITKMYTEFPHVFHTCAK